VATRTNHADRPGGPRRGELSEKSHLVNISRRRARLAETLRDRVDASLLALIQQRVVFCSVRSKMPLMSQNNAAEKL
jgi:hypothetical protein